VANLVLPNLPQSPMFTDQGTMTLEWQDFFLNIDNIIGGIDVTNLITVIEQLAINLYETPTNYNKKLEEVKTEIQAAISAKSYDKRIDDIESMFEALPTPKSYDNEIADLRNVVDSASSTNLNITETVASLSDELEFFIQVMNSWQ
jgi:hypothetical protein